MATPLPHGPLEPTQVVRHLRVAETPNPPHALDLPDLPAQPEPALTPEQRFNRRLLRIACWAVPLAVLLGMRAPWDLLPWN